MYSQWEFVRNARDFREEQRTELRHAPAVNLWLPFLLLISLGDQSAPGFWWMPALMFVFSFPPVLVWLFLPIFSWFFTREHHLLSMDETGIRHRVLKGKDAPQERSFSWQELADRSLVVEYPQFIQLSLMKPGRATDWKLSIPNRIFASSEQLKDFLDKLSERLEMARKPDEMPVIECRYDSQLPEDRQGFVRSEYLWMGIRAASLLSFARAVHLLSVENPRAVAVQLAIIGLASLLIILPKDCFIWISQLYLPRLETLVNVRPDRIEITTIPIRFGRLLFGHGAEFDLNKFGKSGDVEETPEAFLLRYPAGKGRASRSLFRLPKSAFESSQDQEKFRKLVYSKLA